MVAGPDVGVGGIGVAVAVAGMDVGVGVTGVTVAVAGMGVGVLVGVEVGVEVPPSLTTDQFTIPSTNPPFKM